jgi:hypothetical protein
MGTGGKTILEGAADELDALLLEDGSTRNDSSFERLLAMTHVDVLTSVANMIDVKAF